MPRQSPYLIELSEEERRQLNQTAKCYSRPYREVIRAKIVLMAAQGLENKEIAARLDTPRQIVSKWRRRFYYERLEGLREKPRPGRPRFFSRQSGGGD